MATKTWKLGEYCRGGVITVEVKNAHVEVIGKQWDASKGTTRSSCQKDAMPFYSRAFDTDYDGWQWDVDDTLNYLTSSGYADIIMEWIKSKTILK